MNLHQFQNCKMEHSFRVFFTEATGALRQDLLALANQIISINFGTEYYDTPNRVSFVRVDLTDDNKSSARKAIAEQVEKQRLGAGAAFNLVVEIFDHHETVVERITYQGCQVLSLTYGKLQLTRSIDTTKYQGEITRDDIYTIDRQTLQSTPIPAKLQMTSEERAQPWMHNLLIEFSEKDHSYPGAKHGS